VAKIAGGDRRLQGVAGIGDRGVDEAPLDHRLRPEQQQLAAQRVVFGPEVECPRRVAGGLVERADVDRPLGRVAQQVDRLLGDVAGHTGNRADLGDEFGGARRMMGDLVERDQR
jgi:hypothetical protein